MDPGDLTAVVITHEHPDHCVDIYGLHVLLRYALERSGVPVYAPAGADERLGTLAHWGDTFAWHAIDDGAHATVGVDRPRVLPHRPPAAHVRGAGDRRRRPPARVHVRHRPRLERRRVRAGRGARALGGELRARRPALADPPLGQAGRRRGTGRRVPSGSCSPTSGPGSTRRSWCAEGSEAFGEAVTLAAVDLTAAGLSHRRRSAPLEPRRKVPMGIRNDGREPDQLRPLAFTRDYTELAMGSVLVEMGRTRVLCTASVEERVPPWLRGTGKGWVTAEYSMLPGSTPERVSREAAKGKQSGRTQEIQRLIGRSLRAVTDLRDARRGADHGRLRRAPGRRRHAHRVDLRWVPRAPRRVLAAGAGEEAAGAPDPGPVRGDLGRASCRRCRASTSTTRRTRPPRST